MGAGVPRGLQNRCSRLGACLVSSILTCSRHFIFWNAKDTMRNVIVGTAGHVDNGKTCLIKALTGIDADRLKEE